MATPGYLVGGQSPRMRLTAILLIAAALLLPTAAAHGALELNEFDTYAISDFEGQEESFPHEGFEIWDIYAGDGYFSANETHGVYFKGNFAGDGTIRPSGSAEWTLTFTFDVGGTSYERTIVHDGTDVSTDFEQLEHQVADGNVFQMHAWVPIPSWEGETISNLVVLSAVDGDPRDIAPGGIYDPATGQEVPVSAPPTPVFPAMGEGRIVEAVELTGSAKFLDVQATPTTTGATVTVNNTLASQGQHFMLQLKDAGNWTVEGAPHTESIDGGMSTSIDLVLTPPATGTVEPLRLDFMTDIGGLQSWFAYVHDGEVRLVDNEAMAHSYEPEIAGQDAPGLAPMGLIVALALLALRRRG